MGALQVARGGQIMEGFIPTFGLGSASRGIGWGKLSIRRYNHLDELLTPGVDQQQDGECPFQRSLRGRIHVLAGHVDMRSVTLCRGDTADRARGNTSLVFG